MAARRPYSFASTAQLPPIAASVATPAKVNAMPTSIGSPLRRNGCSARANTNGSTGRMHGLTIVSIPAKYDTANRIISGSPGLGGRLERHRNAVHAVPQPRGLRAVLEDVAEVAATATAVYSRAGHAEGFVLGGADGVLDRRPETRPAGPAVVFGIRGKQVERTAGAGERALALLMQQRTGERALSPGPAQDCELIGGQQLAPLVLAACQLESLRCARRRGRTPPGQRHDEAACPRSHQRASAQHRAFPRQCIA